MSYLYLGLFLRQDYPFKGNIPEEDPETSNNRVLRLKREHKQKVKQVGRQVKDLPKGEARFHGFHRSDQRQIQIRFQFFPFVFPDGEG
jgi:hypothetical protein